MIQIFYQQQAVILCEPATVKNMGPNDVCRFGSDIRSLGPLPAFFQTHPNIRRLFIPTDHPDQTLAEIAALHKEIHAAGGLVQNEDGSILMIFRNGYWDLPKGKQEPGEDIRTTAIREVEEECGISNLCCKDLICRTYHTYEMFGETCFKTTHWYAMQHTGQETLQPQTEEGITSLAWVAEKEIPDRLINTYPSIREVFYRRSTTSMDSSNEASGVK